MIGGLLNSYDIIVIGAGAIGLAIARRLAGLGAVLVVEKGATGRKASWAAAGMLTPHSEASSPDAFFRFGARSLCGYRSFVDELRDETGVDMEYRDNGLLLLASDADTLDSIRLRQEWQAREGFDTVLLSPEEVRRMEPALTLELSGALFCPSDHHVRPRLLIDALSASCVLRGVEIVEGTGVDEIVQNGGRVQGVLAGGRTLSAPVVIVAAGAWASGIRGMDPAIEMCPRKGQMLALAAPENLFDHVVRWGHRYFVPRTGGELIVGSTDEDSGFEAGVTAEGIDGLLAAAERMSARASACRVIETWSGLRPATRDRLPAIGPTALGGLLYALGHYRNGILFAPLTAEVVADLVEGRESNATEEAFSPLRFPQNRER